MKIPIPDTSPLTYPWIDALLVLGVLDGDVFVLQQDGLHVQVEHGARGGHAHAVTRQFVLHHDARNQVAHPHSMLTSQLMERKKKGQR